MADFRRPTKFHRTKLFVAILLITFCQAFHEITVLTPSNVHYHRSQQHSSTTLGISSLEREQNEIIGRKKDKDNGKERPSSRGTTMPGFTTRAHLVSQDEDKRLAAIMGEGGDVDDFGGDASQISSLSELGEVGEEVGFEASKSNTAALLQPPSPLDRQAQGKVGEQLQEGARTPSRTESSKIKPQNNIFKNDRSLLKNGKQIKKKTKSQMKATQNYMYRKSNTVPESLLDFVAEIHEQDRITPSEEIALGEKTQTYMQLQALQSNLAKELGRAPTDEEWCAASGRINLQSVETIMKEGLEAKNKLVTANLRLVQRVVNVYIRNGLSSQYNAGDLMQEGTIALIRAAEKFEPSKGFRFSTYAMFWIRASVKRSQLSQSREISVPQRVQEVHKKMQLVKKELSDRGERCGIEQLSQIMGVKVEALEKAEMAMAQKTYSLDCSITNKKKAGTGVDSSHGGSTVTSNLYRFVESKLDLNDVGGVEREMLREDIVKDLRRHLDTERAEIVILRYGLEDVAGYMRVGKDGKCRAGRGDGLSIKELAGIKGMKQDKVRRIIKTSLVKLKPHMKEWLKEV